MVTTLFADNIIPATELKNNQRVWFERAYKTPISITSTKGRNFVLINREQMHNLFLAKEYGENILRYCNELKKETETSEFNSQVFPWAKYLSADERMKFADEVVSAYAQIVHTNSWDILEEVISSWKATAEALTNLEFMKVVNTKKSDRGYIEVD